MKKIFCIMFVMLILSKVAIAGDLSATVPPEKTSTLSEACVWYLESQFGMDLSHMTEDEIIETAMKYSLLLIEARYRYKYTKTSKSEIIRRLDETLVQ